MKTILSLALLVSSMTAFAFEQKATLDFTNLYGKTDAGLYEMTVNLNAKKTLSESVLTFSTHRDDNDLYCVTTATFEIGEMNFSLVEKRTGWVQNITKKVTATLSVQSADETCETDIEKFAGNQSLYATLGLNIDITLPVKAPFDYKRVGTYLAPFNGYLYLNTLVEVKGDKLSLNPSKLFDAASILSTNSNNSSVTYYVFAQKEATTLSLGTGLIRF